MKGAYTMKSLLIILTSLVILTSIWAEDYTWNGGNGEWATESNWTPNGTPGSSDSATISSGTVTVTGNISVGTLTLSNASISGAGTLTITSAGTLTSSFLQGNGGSTVIGSGATVTLGDGEHRFRERVLNIEGTLIHTGTNNVLLESVLIEIKTGGTLELQSDALWKYNGSGAPTITNAGTLQKSAGTGESRFDTWANKIDNSGRVEALSGTINLEDGVTNGGTFHAEAGAKIIVTKSSLADVSFTGTGTVELNGGLTLSGLCDSTSAQITNTTAYGDHTLTGSWKLYQSTLREGNTTIHQGSTFRLLGDGDNRFYSQTVDNSGTVIHEGSGNLLFVSSTIENRATGLIDIRSDGDWLYNGNDAPRINNAGTFRKSGGSDVSIFEFHWNRGAINNTGTIESTEGTMQFNQGLTGGGTIHAGAGAQIVLQGPSNLTDVSFTGPGIQRATGSLLLYGDCYSENLEIAGASISGTQTFHGTWHWASGGFDSGWDPAGTATIAQDGYFRIITDGEHKIKNHILINHGVIEHVGTGHVVCYTSSQVTNATDGILVLDSMAEWRDIGNVSYPTTLTNEGTIYETSASDTVFTFFNLIDTGTHIAENAWIEDPDHGWIYMTGFDGYGYFVFDHALQAWAWIPFHHYPYNFRYGIVNAWTWHVEGTSTPNRWGYVFWIDTPAWHHEAELMDPGP